MSSYTYICETCGALRRRPQVGWRPGTPMPARYPQCHGQPMEIVRKAHGEAATKLTPADRVTWIRLGRNVFRRPDRRWTAALTERQVELARRQIADYRASNERAT